MRTGSRGLFWLEPLVEVETRGGPHRLWPGRARTTSRSLFDAGLLDGGAHPKALGRVEEIPYLQEPAAADLRALRRHRSAVARRLSPRTAASRASSARSRSAPTAIVEEVVASGLRGRGGAGFPTGIKWRTVAGVDADQKYVVCNADEGDSGTFADRMLMEGDPFLLIEGMAIAALAVGATKGYVYIRSEYPHAFAHLRDARSQRARAAGLLGADVLGSGNAFDIEARLGAGAYICGEETSLLESLEGKRGLVRAKPPLPAIQGLFGKPTVINNVLSFASDALDPRRWRARPTPITASAARAARSRSSSPATSSAAAWSNWRSA